MVFEYLILLIFILVNIFFSINFEKINAFQINLDIPDSKRKFHKKTTPRAGGILLSINIILYLIIITNFKNLINLDLIFHSYYSLNIFFISYFMIFILGYFDDKFNLNPNLKFCLIAIIITFLFLFDKNTLISFLQFSFYQKKIDLGFVSIFFAIFCFLVYLNAFNMFDGINLQATLYSLIILIFITFFLVDILLIKVLIIFLFFFTYLNYKNKSFLGDSGSLSLSFIIGYILVILYNLNYIEFADDVVIFMIIPGIDLIRLFIFRLLNKKNPLRSDRNHLHHYLISKYSYKTTLFIILMLIIFPILLNYLGFKNIFIFVISTIIYFLILFSASNSKKNILFFW